MLASTSQTYRPSPEERPYAPSGAALALLRDHSPEVVLEGPAGTGKSRALLEKAHICAEKYAGCRILLVRKTRESMTESVLVTLEEKVLPPGHPALLGPARAGRQSYLYPNGSAVVVAGLVANGHDQKAKVMSTEYDMILCFEATELSEHEYEQLMTRLRNGVMPYQQIVADCNPDAPTHWLHLRCDAGVAKVHFSRHEDNPELYRNGEWTRRGAAYISTLDRLTGSRRERLRYGKRAASEGLVYEGWDSAVHLIPHRTIPPEWPRYRVIDFGYTNPFVCLWAAEDNDGRLYIYRQWYKARWTVDQHADKINALDAGERIVATVADHDAEDRATLAQKGIATMGAMKAVTVGIQKVEERLKVAGDGKPRLFVVEGSLVEIDPVLVEEKRPWCLEQEINGYRWPKGVDGKPVKEEPIKINDHAMDALRYLVMFRDGGGIVTYTEALY